MIEKQLNGMILHKNAKFADFRKEIGTLKSNLSKHEKENESLMLKIDALKKETKEKEDKYFNKDIDLEKEIKELKNIAYKIEQDFWLRLLNLTFEQPIVQSTPVRTEAPKELLEGFKHTKGVFNTKVIPFIKNLWDLFNDLDDNIALEMLKIKNDHLIELLISQDLVHTASNSLAAINSFKSMQQSYVDEYNESLNLKAELVKKNNMLEAKDVSIEKLKKHTAVLKGKSVVESDKSNNVTREHTDKLRDLVEHPRAIHPVDSELHYACQIVKSSLNKKNHVSTSVCNESVKQSVLNANSELICATCKKCMFDDVHDSYVVAFINDVSVNGKNFTIVGNACPLTRITPTKVMPPKENGPSTPNIKTPSPKFKVFHRSTKVAKVVSFNNTPSILRSKSSSIKEPMKNWGSKFAISPSSSNLAKQSVARGLPKLKFKKDHLFSTCSLGKSKKSSHKPKADDTNQEKIYLLHMDLCGPMRMESINRKKYILNGVVERQKCTLVKAARTMLIFSKASLFLPDLSYIHVFCSLCYPTNDSKDLGKLKAKPNIGIFVGYAHAKKPFRIYNKRTHLIIETIHVTFDELTSMAFEQFSLGPAPNSMTPGTFSSRLVPNPVP
ncbi:hypothetical protein Tco_1383952 [Tanacetum coccineum]